MERRRIGTLEVAVVGLGCNNLGTRIGLEETRAVVDAAIDAGVDTFDTADVYRGDLGTSEELLAEALGDRRHDVVIATKFGHEVDGGGGARPEWVGRAADASLRRLRRDHLDLYQLHRPDPDVPIAETLGALDELVRAGKVREIGCSNFSAAQLDEAAAASERDGLARFVSVQNRYSVLTRDVEEDGVLDACARHDLVLLPYFPLESGLLTGKYRSGEDASGRLATMAPDRRSRFVNDRTVQAVERLTAHAAAHDRTLLELAVSYLVSEPRVACVIAGATKPEQVRANVAAAAWALSAGARADLRRLAG